LINTSNCFNYFSRINFRIQLKTWSNIKKPWPRGKTESPWLRGNELNPTPLAYPQRKQNPGNNLITRHCFTCCTCNPGKGRVDLPEFTWMNGWYHRGNLLVAIDPDQIIMEQEREITVILWQWWVVDCKFPLQIPLSSGENFWAPLNPWVVK